MNKYDIGDYVMTDSNEVHLLTEIYIHISEKDTSVAYGTTSVRAQQIPERNIQGVVTVSRIGRK